MSFGDTLRSGCFCLDLLADTKDGVIEELVEVLAQAGKIRDRTKVLHAIMERERKMSTGVSEGVAIPHGKTDAVDEMVTVFGLKRTGIDFQAFDGKPSRLFIMTVSPLNRTGPHIRYLGEISKLLKQEPIRARLLEARTREDVIQILTTLSAAPEGGEG